MVRFDFLGSFSNSPHRNKIVFLLVSIIFASLMLELSLIKIYSISVNELISNMGITFFVGIGIVYVIGQYLLLKFVKGFTNKRRMGKELHLNLARRSVTVGQYILTAILVFVILQMVLTSRYSVITLVAVTSISCVLSIVMLGLLAQKFFSWFKTRKEKVILLYGLSSSMLALNAILTIAYVDLVLTELPPYISPHPALQFFPFIAPGSVTDILYSGFVVSSILSFMLTWSATVLLLRYLSQRLGRARYWIILSLPSAYFLIQFLPLFYDVFSLFSQSVSVFYLYTLFFTFSRPVGAILFGLAFWMIARRLRQSGTDIQNYMIISGIGLVLLFVSNQAIVFVDEPYPPFGFASVSLMGLSSYLVLIGIYSSAISISEDSRLRNSIRNFALKEANLLDSIGSAHMEQEIQKKVIEFTKRNQDRIAEEAGVQSSLTEDDMKSYLQQVIREIQNARKGNNNHHK